MSKDTIILARHGEPALERDVRLNWQGYEYWWHLYDEGGIKDSSLAPDAVRSLAQDADIVISSPLRRAVETAERAVGHPPDLIMDTLVEAPLPPPNLGPIRLKPRPWGALARISWMLGFSRDKETYTQARARARETAKLLAAEASGGKTVFVTAHGWFNRMLRPELKKLGFKVTEDHGDQYWDYRRYDRETRNQAPGENNKNGLE